MKYRIIENIHRLIDTWDSDSRDASPWAAAVSPSSPCEQLAQDDSR
jgi:hypothetical protein